MNQSIYSATSIGKIARKIASDLNKDEPSERYSVTPLAGSPGTVRVVDHTTNKSRSVKLKYQNDSRRRTVPVKWAEHFHVDEKGNVFDADGKFVGTALIMPASPNKRGTSRSYLYDGMFNDSPDSWREITEENLSDLKDTLQ